MEAYWIITDQLQPGDIIEVPSKVPSSSPIFPDMLTPLVRHYGVIVTVDNKIMVIHNPFGGKPEMITLEKATENRRITRVLRTGRSNEFILERFKKCQDSGVKYEFLGYNCEKLVEDLADIPPFIDQRRFYAFVLLILVIIALLILLTRKRS